MVRNVPKGQPTIDTPFSGIPLALKYLGKDLPIYWGDNQIIDQDSNEYTDPVMPDNMPLHIPRVVRFLYSFDKENQGEPAKAEDCSSGEQRGCVNTICEWRMDSMTFAKRVGVTQLTADNGYFVYITSNPGNWWNINGTPYISNESQIDAIQLRVQTLAIGGAVLYEGPAITGSPYTTFGYQRTTIWVYDCYNKGDDGGPDLDDPTKLNASVFTLTIETGQTKDTSLQCDRPIDGGGTISDYPSYTGCADQDSDPCGDDFGGGDDSGGGAGCGS